MPPRDIENTSATRMKSTGSASATCIARHRSRCRGCGRSASPLPLRAIRVSRYQSTSADGTAIAISAAKWLRFT